MGVTQQRPQVIVVKQKQSGCLSTAVVFLLFGWIGLAAVAAWKAVQLAWRWTVAVGWKLPLALVRLSWAACIAGTRWAIRGGAWLTARYGARGWAALAGGLVVLAILSALFSRH